MNTFVIFLRGINVGGNNIIAMADVRTCLLAAGFVDVKTIGHSGTVVVTTEHDISSVASTASSALKAAFAFEAPLVVRSLHQLTELMAAYPFDQSDKDTQCNVVFTDGKAQEYLLKQPIDSDVESVLAADGCIFWGVKKGYSTKTIFAKKQQSSHYKSSITVRNMNTLQKVIK